MTLREMYSSYSLLQRISKRKQISKTGGFACKKEPEYCGITVILVLFCSLFLIYNYIIFP